MKPAGYEVNMFEQYKESYHTCYGEAKINTCQELLQYSICIGCISSASQKFWATNLTKIFCFQVISPSTTSYHMEHHTRATACVIAKLGTIEISTTQKDIMIMIITLNKLLKIVTIYRNLEEKGSTYMNTHHPTLSFNLFKGKRRHCQLKQNHF